MIAEERANSDQAINEEDDQSIDRPLIDIASLDLFCTWRLIGAPPTLEEIGRWPPAWRHDVMLLFRRMQRIKKQRNQGEQALESARAALSRPARKRNRRRRVS